MSNRHRRTTLVDVAEAAGVSLATVDRVLNHRPGVSPRTMERVEQSLVRLGYRPDPAAVRLARGIQYQFCFVLPSGTNTFMSLLASQVDRTLMSLAEQQAYGDVLRVDVFDPQGLASTLARLDRAVSRRRDGGARPSGRARCDRRDGRSGHGGGDAGVRRAELAPASLCRHRQFRGRPHGRDPDGPLRRPAQGAGGIDRRQPGAARSCRAHVRLPAGDRLGIPAAAHPVRARRPR